jgi:hypothetical protein
MQDKTAGKRLVLNVKRSEFASLRKEKQNVFLASLRIVH